MNKEQDKSPDEPDFAQVSEQLAKLETKKEESEQDKRFDVVWKGATWGMVAGLVIGKIIISRNSEFGIYLGGDVGVLLFKTVGGGAAIGAFFAWLSMKLPSDKERR